MKKITLLIPAYNEASNLMPLAQALAPLIDNGMTRQPYEWEVLMVNDGSLDNTLEVMQQLRRLDQRYNYVNLSRNFGKESAMLAGLDHATGHAVVILDADLQHPIDVIPQMIEHWEEGYDDVYGHRSSRLHESWLRRTLSRGFYRVLQSMSSVDVLPDVGDFRLLDRKCVNALCQMRESQRYSKGLFVWIGFRKKRITYTDNVRVRGKSKFNFFSLIDLAVNGLTSFSTAPLRMASVMGIIAAFAALAYLIYVFVRTLIYGDPVAGYPTLMCVILFLGACQLIALGIIGEYIARIFIESKRRPPYLIDSYNGAPPRS